MSKEKEIIRYNPSPDTGLSDEIVSKRNEDKLTNKTNIVVGKTYFEIVLNDVFNFFNVLLFIIAIFMVIAEYYAGLFFLFVIIPNIVIGLYEDIKARKLMSKTRVLTQPKIHVVRNGNVSEIRVEEIVLDDIVELSSACQICADGEIVDGSVLINESLLTGESQSISKQKGDKVYSGSFVVSGTAKMHVTEVGKDSYVEKLQSKAKKFKRSPSQILKSLRVLFRVIGCVVIAFALATIIFYAVRGEFSTFEKFKNAVKSISGSMVAMIPSGLYLLTSVALAVAVISLNKKKARVQDFYAVEMLARTDVLCVDKTGTITDGTMVLKSIISFGHQNLDIIKQMVADLLETTNDKNATALALKQACPFKLSKVVCGSLPFNSDNKYSAASFRGVGTYVLGAPEFINMVNKPGVLKRVSEYTKDGYRVVIIGVSKEMIHGDTFTGEVTPVAMLVLQDHIREAAVSTFAWFKQNGVAIKVISGDNAQTVSEIARQAGIENAEQYISLENMSIDEVMEIADQYTVFGRVNPEQKEAIVNSLKEKGKTVAMTGDGVNDILALKRSDCSIAMAEGSEAAKNVSHIVLLDSNFDSLPSIVNEGRRVVNNLQRTSSLFLVKTLFAMVLSFVFLIVVCINGHTYPFFPTHFYIWEILSVGLPAFFLALQPNSEKMKGSFLKNILRKAIPAGITVICMVMVIFLLYLLSELNLISIGIYSRESAIAMSVIIFTAFSSVSLLKICLPFDKYRGAVFGCSIFLVVCSLLIGAYLSYNNGVENSLFQINFPTLNPINYFTIAIVFVLGISIYLFVTYMVEAVRGEHNNDN